MRRTRRRKATWFPTFGTAVGVAGEANLSGRQFILTVPEGDIVNIITPLTFDQSKGDDQDGPSQTSLADIIGSGYILQRIVGKCFAHRISAPEGGADLNSAVLFAAGFFIARQNDEGSGGGSDTPIGSASAAEARDNYSPLEQDTIREPWIWRRTWVLGTAGQTSGATPAEASTNHFPASTALFGSVADGPHIDSRVKRRVSQDDRLWFCASASTFPIDTIVGTLLVQGYLDFRILATLVRNRNRSAF